MGPEAPVGRYPNIWCPSKNQLLQILWDGFIKMCLNHSLGLFPLPPRLSEWSSRLPGHSVCPHGFSARHSPSLPTHRGLSPRDVPRVNAKAVHGPGQAGINNTALVAILATRKSQRESPWVVASVCWCSGKGWCRVLLVQPLKCKEPNATKKLSPVPLLYQDKSSYHGEGRAEGVCTMGRA